MKKIKQYINIVFILTFKWLYNHNKLFRRFVKNKAKKQSEMNLILLELFMSKEPINVEYWCNRIAKTK